MQIVQLDKNRAVQLRFSRRSINCFFRQIEIVWRNSHILFLKYILKYIYTYKIFSLDTKSHICKTYKFCHQLHHLLKTSEIINQFSIWII
jgi:hypothetical protein